MAYVSLPDFEQACQEWASFQRVWLALRFQEEERARHYPDRTTDNILVDLRAKQIPEAYLAMERAFSRLERLALELRSESLPEKDERRASEAFVGLQSFARSFERQPDQERDDWLLSQEPTFLKLGQELDAWSNRFDAERERLANAKALAEDLTKEYSNAFFRAEESEARAGQPEQAPST